MNALINTHEGLGEPIWKCGKKTHFLKINNPYNFYLFGNGTLIYKRFLVNIFTCIIKIKFLNEILLYTIGCKGLKVA